MDGKKLNRIGISNECKVPKWMVDMCVLVLSNRHYLKQDGLTYYLTSQLFNVTPQQVNEWVYAYRQDTKDAKTINEETGNGTILLRTVDNYGQIQNFSFPLNTTGTVSISEPTEIKPDCNFGFFTAEGSHWFETIEEAGEQAKCASMAAGLTQLDVVQKVAKVINQPIITYLRNSLV